METKFDFNSQVCTDRFQSERLLALGLKKETADCGIYYSELAGCDRMFAKIETEFEADEIPAWSLHRLLYLIPKKVNIDGYRFPLRFDVLMRLDEADDMYEYIIDVLERVIKGGSFNKEYLV